MNMNLQFFGGRGSAGGTNMGGSGNKAVVESKSPEVKPSKSAEDLVSKIASLKNAKSAGKYLQTSEQRAQVLAGMKQGDLMTLDFKTPDGRIRSITVQRAQDNTYYIDGTGSKAEDRKPMKDKWGDIASGNLKQVTRELEKRLKNMSVAGNGAFISRGWEKPQHIPHDYDENKPSGRRITYRFDKVRKLK